MAIQLTTPFSPGDLDPGKSYTHVKVTEVKVVIDFAIIATCVRGYMEEGEFVAGVQSTWQEVEIRDKPKQSTTHYTEVINGMPTTLEIPVFAQTAMNIYQKLIDEYGFDGVFVP